MTNETPCTPDDFIRAANRTAGLAAFGRTEEDGTTRIMVRARGPHGENWHTYMFDADGLLDAGPATMSRCHRLLERQRIPADA